MTREEWIYELEERLISMENKKFDIEESINYGNGSIKQQESIENLEEGIIKTEKLLKEIKNS